MQFKDNDGPVKGLSITPQTLEENRKRMLEAARPSRTDESDSSGPAPQPEITNLNATPQEIEAGVADAKRPNIATPQQPVITAPTTDQPKKHVDALREQASQGTSEKLTDEDLSYENSAQVNVAKSTADYKVNISPPTEKKIDGATWQRLDFPSLGVFYESSEAIFVRPLSVPTLNKIYISIERSDPSMYFDALNEHVSIDVRDLTYPDFVYFCYWLRIESFPSTPYTIPWTSRYGNPNKVVLRKMPFKIVELKMTRDEYAKYKSHGIVMPTLRESEFISQLDNANQVDRDNQWAVNYAQYMDVSDLPMDENIMRNKIDRFLNHPNVEIITLINQFANENQHGIEETLTLKDENFDQKKAVAFLENIIESIRMLVEARLEANSGEPDADILGMMEKMEEYQTELKDIQEANEKEEVYTPKEEEVVTRPLRDVDMFPNPEQFGLS